MKGVGWQVNWKKHISILCYRLKLNFINHTIKRMVNALYLELMMHNISECELSAAIM